MMEPILISFVFWMLYSILTGIYDYQFWKDRTDYDFKINPLGLIFWIRVIIAFGFIYPLGYDLQYTAGFIFAFAFTFSLPHHSVYLLWGNESIISDRLGKGGSIIDYIFSSLYGRITTFILGLIGLYVGVYGYIF